LDLAISGVKEKANIRLFFWAKETERKRENTGFQYQRKGIAFGRMWMQIMRVDSSQF